MKDSKGFTLVELLATITILGILSAVAVNGVTQYLQKSKKQAFETLEKNMKVGINDYFIDHSAMIPAIGASRTITARTLLDEGYITNLSDPDSKGQNCNLDTSNITVTRGGNANDFNMTFTYKVCVRCSKMQSKTC